MSRFNFKLSKSQAPNKAPCVIYKTSNNEPIWETSQIQVLSIDPAVKNFALRIERRLKTDVLTIAFEKMEFKNDETLYSQISDFLDKFENMFFEIHYFIVEKQLPQNYQAVRISQHVITYFQLKLRTSLLCPKIVELDPKLKSKMLKAPRGLNSKELKNWSVEVGTQLLTKRNDKYALKILEKTKKKDDLCDTVIQSEALFLYFDSL